jgi:hypothetical protein
MVRGGVHGDVGRTADGGRVAESRQKLDAPLPLTHVLTGFTAHWFDRNEIPARLRCSCRCRRKLTRTKPGRTASNWGFVG